METKGFPVPIEILLHKEHSSGDPFHNYLYEIAGYCREKGLVYPSRNVADSTFRGQRISKSNWYLTLPLPESCSLISSLENLRI
jgi:hypothetical protein